MAIDIIRACAEEYGTDMADIDCKSRERQFTKVRHMAIYLLYHKAGMVYNEIGRVFGCSCVGVRYAVVAMAEKLRDSSYAHIHTHYNNIINKIKENGIIQ